MTSLMIWLSFLIRKMPKNRKKEINISINLQSLTMVPSRRLERLTYGLEGSCSIQLSYEGKFAKRLYIILKLDIFFKFYLLIPS